MSKHSEACCNIPPVISKGYEPKGKYVDLAGMKTYATGPSSATQAILVIYDIFGFFPQTIQGADILAHSDKEHQYQVYVPDFFHGSPADPAWHPPKTEEHQQKLGAFFQNEAEPSKTLKAIPQVVEAVNKQTGGKIQKWGIVGYCWGGKITSLSSGKDTLFSAAAELHPAMLDPKDAEAVTIPLCILASKDESADDVKAFEKTLKGEKHVEIYDDQVHGWMSARADLEDKKAKSEYERGYKKLLTFFHDNL